MSSSKKAQQSALRTEQVAELRKLGCSDNTIIVLGKACIEFAGLTPKERVQKTIAERLREVVKVHDLARQLDAALSELSNADYLDLFFRMGGKPNEALEAARFLPMLLEETKEMMSELEEKRSSPEGKGRRRTSGVAHSMLLLVTYHAGADGIRPSRSGKFLSICSLCFTASGLGDAEPILRRFLGELRDFHKRHHGGAKGAA